MQAAPYNSCRQSPSKSRFMFLLEATSMTLPTKRASGPASAINVRMGIALNSSVAHAVHLASVLELRLTHFIAERHDAFG